MEFLVTVQESDLASQELLERLAQRAQVLPMVRGRGTALALGGARSGKSAWAEAELAHREVVEYVATSEPMEDDPEWQHRVALHRERRPAAWKTTETLDLESVLRADDPAPVLIDCASLWLTRVLTEVGAWDDRDGWREALEDRVDSLAQALVDTQREVIIVSNEVGSGVVPAYPSGRLYRDEMGRLNARLAAAVDEVWFCLAGIARRLK